MFSGKKEVKRTEGWDRGDEEGPQGEGKGGQKDGGKGKGEGLLLGKTNQRTATGTGRSGSLAEEEGRRKDRG